MKSLSTFFLVLLSINSILAQADDIRTTGNNSPAVIANNFSAIYGVRADAIEAILWIYEAKGYNVAQRKRATAKILTEYAQSPEKQQKADILSEASRRKMNITDVPKVVNALEWDLFAHRHYLSTIGYNSPAVMAKGDVNIWYGIPPKALRALATQLEKYKTDIANFEENQTNFEAKLAGQVKKYEELKTKLETYGSQEEIYRQAEGLLEEGKLEEVEKLLKSNYHPQKKKFAYEAYYLASVLELNLKYGEAAIYYKDAIETDEQNATYHLFYAHNENTLAHYDEAIKHSEIALEIYNLKSGNEENIATLLNNLGGAWFAKGEYGKAIEYFKKALQLDLKAFGDSHPNVAAVYNNLGEALREKGEYDKAIDYYDKALQIDVKVFGESHPKVATEYTCLGTTWREKGNYDKAIDYFEKALQIFFQILGDSHPNVAAVYNNLGLSWKEKGKYDKAIDYYEKALQISLKAFGDDHPNIATGYNNFGEVCRINGEYDKAIGYYDKALQIYLKTIGENHPNVAATYNNLGLTWVSKWEYDKAIAYYDKALQIYLKAFGDSHPSVAKEYSNLGSAWALQGKHDKAIGYFEKALQIGKKAFGDNHPSVATRYNNLGEVLRAKEEYDKAIEYFDKALQIDLKAFGDSHPSVARECNNLGLTWASKREYNKAIEYLDKALQINLKTLGDSNPSVATVYNNLGEVWELIGKYDKAIWYFEKALQIYLVFGDNQPIVGMMYNNLGRACASKEQYDKAIIYYEKALKIAQMIGDDAYSFSCISNIGLLQKYLKKYAEGLQILDIGLQKAAQINKDIDQAIKEQFTSEMLDNPKVQAEIAELKNLALIRTMQFHKVGCLKGLKRNKEADTLAKQLWQQGIEDNDTQLLEDLSKEGYNFGKN